MPYVSDKQRRYFHWKAQTDPDFKKYVKEYDKETKGKDLPEEAPKEKSAFFQLGFITKLQELNNEN